jgi:hypothetical protein
MNGYHIYYKSSPSGKYHEIDLLVNVASCLYWKQYYGSIKLYCNQEFLDYLKKYNVDQFYDEIDTQVLENIPYKEHLDRYWSFCKIYVAKEITKTDNKFVIFDNDWYPTRLYNFDQSYNFIGYHKEVYDPRSEGNVYVDPKIYLSDDNYNKIDWDIEPINCAFMYFNSKDLVNTWYAWAEGVINTTFYKTPLENNRDTIFIEQRLLPAIANTLKLKIDTLLPNVYLQYIEFNDEGHEWFPMIDSHPKYRQHFNNFRHTWGLKRYYDVDKWRRLIIHLTLEDLHNLQPNGEYKNKVSNLVETCKSFY